MKNDINVKDSGEMRTSRFNRESDINLVRLSLKTENSLKIEK